MNITLYVNKFKLTRYNFFKWRYNLEFMYKLSLAMLFACVMGLLAQLRFFLPPSPVPITGQVFGVFLAGILLGKWGGISQCIYTGFGVMGVPWFAGLNSGFSYLFGPTGGYLIGFIFAAFFIGYFTDRHIRSRGFFSMFALMLFATFILIYIPGLIFLYIWMGSSIGIAQLLMIGMIPYIVVDVIKAIITAVIAKGITPKRSYAKESVPL